MSKLSLAVEMAPHTVYILQDREGYAIYVGMTMDLPRRLSEHRRRAYWRYVASVWTEGAPDRQSARRVERAHIAMLAPQLNVQGQVLL